MVLPCLPSAIGNAGKVDPDPRLVCNGSYPSASTSAPVILSILTHASLGGVVGDYQFRIDPVFKPALLSGDETSLRGRDPIFAPSVYDSMLGATLDVLGPPMHAEIAGAGFAGLAAAIALHRRGWSVIVHEKEPELRAFGAGIFIWENGQRVLQAIGAYPDVARGAHQAPGYETRRNGVCVSFETINGGNPFLLMTMTRQHLYSAILASVAREGIEIVTRSEAVAARPEGVLELASGHRRKADLVIAADGVRSAVRESLGIACSRRKYQDGIVRVLVERGSFVGGAWDHVIDFWAFEPRTLRILYAPCEDGRLYMAMMSPRDDKQASKLPVDPTVWASVFPMLAPAIKSVGSRGRYDVYETTRLDSWSVGHVAIVGDAAHAMPPTLAQGACLAMMNALSLAEFVSEGSDLTVDLQRWEKRERALTDHTQSRSAELARTRALGSGMQWDDIGMRAARHVPTGTRPEEFSRLWPSAGI